MNYMINGIMFC